MCSWEPKIGHSPPRRSARRHCEIGDQQKRTEYGEEPALHRAANNAAAIGMLQMTM